MTAVEIPAHTAEAAQALAGRYRRADAARMTALQGAAAEPARRDALMAEAVAHQRDRDRAGAELAAILAPVLAPMEGLDTPPRPEA